MKKLAALSFFIISTFLTVSFGSYAVGAGGITRTSTESETVSASPGKSVSVRSTCTRGMALIGGGGECFGFLVTEGRAELTRSAPTPDGTSWYVECVNSGTRPGDIQARAWAICADSGVFATVKMK